MNQEVVFTNQKGLIKDVVDNLLSGLKWNPEVYKGVIFFASSDYDFSKLSVELKSRFSEAEVVGTSTSGEISSKGFTKGTIVLTAFKCEKTILSGVLVEGVDKFPIIHKQKIIDAMSRCNIYPGNPNSHKHSFALTFVNGLCNAEEAFLSLFYAIIQNDNFIVAGGSAGDDLKFRETYVSYNGQTISDGAVILFFTTELKIDIRKENIYKPSGKQVRITKVDTKTRTIKSINNKNAKVEYASVVNRPISEISNAILDHPFGRVFGANIFISSLASFNADDSINMYCRVLPNSTVDILEPDDYESITVKTCDEILEAIPKPQFILLVNCILRTINFENKNACQKLTQLYNEKFPVWCGFSSYGEQFGKMNSNQTLVSIVLGE